MRLEATLPDSRGLALTQLAEDLGMTRSQLVDEAVGLFLKAVLEVRRGNRLMSVSDTTPACELSTPTLATLEWATHTQAVHLSSEEAARLQALLEQPAAPTPHLRAAAARAR